MRKRLMLRTSERTTPQSRAARVRWEGKTAEQRRIEVQPMLAAQRQWMKTQPPHAPLPSPPIVCKVKGCQNPPAPFRVSGKPSKAERRLAVGLQEFNRRRRLQPRYCQWHMRADYRMRTVYRVGLEEYLSLYRRQRGRCAICRKPGIANGTRQLKRTGSRDTLVVDHDHQTKKIRGLLCWNCNRALGQLDDSPKNFRRAAEYLEEHHA